MSDSVQLEESSREIGFGEIIRFVRRYWKKMILFAVTSLAVLLFFALAGFLLCPCESAYVCPISVQLQRNGRTIVYPSNRPFSANDIISTAVLRQIYENNDLARKMPFGDFCKLFYISGIDVEKSVLAASFQSKLAYRSKTISLVELKSLENEYAEELQKLDHSSVQIAMSSFWKLSPQESCRILRQVPATWFDVYSKLEAKVMPRPESIARVRALRDGVAADGLLITLDRARLVCQDLKRTCGDLQALVMGQNVSLASGESLEDILCRLQDLELHRIRPLLMLVFENPGYKRSAVDDAFLRSTILDLERRIEVLKERYEGAAEGINILQARNPAPVSKAAAKAEQEPSLALNNLDGSFFASLAALIRGSQSIGLREKYAADALQFRENMAELNATKSHYEHLLKQLTQDDQRKKTASSEQFKQLEKRMFDELLLLCGKVHDFRELIMKRYLSDRQFFVTTGEVLKISRCHVLFKYYIAILFLLFIAVNGVYAGLRFHTALSGGELKK